MSNPGPYIRINLQEIRTQNENARHIIAGFAAAAPTLADIWHNVTSALDDLATLTAEVTRLAAELQRARLERANLIAAARATIAAHRDGEPDPLAYLRDELDTLPARGEAGR